MYELEELFINDNKFLINGIKGFAKDYKKDIENINLNENNSIKKIYASKKDTIRYIIAKRKEYKVKISSIENSIIILSNTLKDLEFEGDLRSKRNRENIIEDNGDKENLEDIIDAIVENKKIIRLEEDKIEKIKEDYKKFNEASLEEEKLVYIFFNYIKREYIKFRRNIVKKLNSNTLSGAELVLTYEYLLIITKIMICIEEDLLGG